jgi:hypothetical protein
MSAQYLRLGKAQWLYLAAALLIVLPCVLAVAFEQDVDLWLMRRFEFPALQASYGFTAAPISQRSADGCSYTVFTITAVAPNGPFARAGIQPGDAPTRYVHGAERGFLYDLMWARRGHSISLALISAEDLAAGRWKALRRVTLGAPES